MYFLLLKIKKHKISGTPPEPRYNHSAILAGSRIIIFGGKVKSIYLQKGKKNSLQRSTGLGSSNHDLVSRTRGKWFTIRQIQSFCHAGWGDQNANIWRTKCKNHIISQGVDFFNDVYILDLEVMAWSKPNCTGPAPTARASHTAI